MHWLKRSTRHGRSLVGSALLIQAMLGIAFPAAAASEVQRTFEYDLLFPKSLEGAEAPMTIVAPEIAPALERPIDPATYRIVPGDLLQLEVGGETDRAWRLAVSAEGQLILPGAASVEASGNTLEELVTLVRQHLGGHFPETAIALHLLQPGTFLVPVTGQVNHPSLRPLHAYDRVTFAITSAGGTRPDASLRHVRLRAPDGTEQKCDLIRFALLGEIDQNPTVHPGTSIHVPPAHEFVHVTGAVQGLVSNRSGPVPNVGSRIAEPPRILLEWKEGDTIGFILTRAGGLSPEASGTILMVRDGERTIFDLPGAESVAVQAGDLIEVSMRDRYIYVIGAVRYPGPYAHLPSLTAADYVQLAGGPTEIGRGSGWRVRLPDGRESDKIGPETYLVAGSTVRVPERWTYRVSTLLGPISGITALVISLVALRN